MTEGKPDNKINIQEEWERRVKEIVDAPEIMIKATGYYLQSAILGEFFTNPSLPIGSQRPNLWFILSSIPARMRRSTVQRTTYDSIKHIIGNEEAANMVVEEGSPEGITDAISQLTGASCTIQSTEFGAVLIKARNGSGYEFGTLSLLSKLYYGEGGKQSLSQRGGKDGSRILPEGLYVTMLTGLQEPKNYFTISMLEQGLLRRLLVVYVSKNDRWKPPINQIRAKIDLSDIEDELRKRRGYLKDKTVYFMFDTEAERKVNDFAKECDKAIDSNKLDNLTLYKASMWEHLAKLSTINAINRWQILEDGQSPVMEVRLEDVNKAETFLNEVMKNFDPIIENLGVRDETERSHETTLNKIFWKIYGAGDEGITADRLGRTFSGMLREELSKYTETLVMQGRIQVVAADKKRRGRPASCFMAKEFVPNEA